MDNKYWINNRFKDSINGYQNILSKMLPDICYHMNKVLLENKINMTCINTAVEASNFII